MDTAIQQNPVVFVSHSHVDRDFALYVDRVLKQNGAQTFLDQEQLIPGENLPSRHRLGATRMHLPAA
jgi:hypothetical protein